jgi:hypothetical protein
VTTSRASRRSRRQALVLAALACVACGASQAPVVAGPAAGTSSAEPPRRPDGVVLEPPPAIPQAVTIAEARGVVALRPSLSGDAIRDCVRDLLDAWQRGSLDGLSELLTSDAGPLEARARGPGALVEAWRQRLRAHEYRRLEGLDLVRPDRVEHYAFDELGGPDAPARPTEMHPDEIYVRVPLEVTQVAGEKLFEGTIVLLVRGEHGKARITAYGEVR